MQIRKVTFIREKLFEEMGRRPEHPFIRAVALAVIHNPFAGLAAVEDLSALWEMGGLLGEELMPDLIRMLDRPAVSYGKGAIVGVPDAPRPSEIVVALAIADGGRLWNRCGGEPAR